MNSFKNNNNKAVTDLSNISMNSSLKTKII